MGVSATSMLSNGYDSDMMMKLMIAQLQNQNPMEPLDDTQMMQQMTQMVSLETMTGLKSTFEELLEVQQVAAGTGMVGREVEFVTDDGTASGIVESMNRTGDGIELSVGPREGEEGLSGTIMLSDVTRIF